MRPSRLAGTKFRDGLSRRARRARAARAHNFSGGPGALPEPVLDEASAALVDFEGRGDSILGLSHRSDSFAEIVDEAERTLLRLLGLGASHRVLFLQGGSTLQFSMVPMHFLQPGAIADYLVGGYWSARSLNDARLGARARSIWSDGRPGGTRMLSALEIAERADPDAAYFHYVSNETVEGVRVAGIPGHEHVPRICDMSSDFLSAPIDASRFDLLYAHAQKNLGPAGVTIVVAPRRVLERDPIEPLPPFLTYRAHAEADSIYNTPPVFSIYVTLLVLRWLERVVGGLAEMAVRNRAKADRLYALLDAHPEHFVPHAEPQSRSMMNVAFRLRDPTREPALLARADARRLYGLAGHRSLGGLRASLYNAVSLASVDALCELLLEDAR